MMYVALGRLLLGLLLLGVLGMIIAAVTQAGGVVWLANRLDRKDRLEYERNGWPKRSDFPVVGAPDFDEKLQAMLHPKRRRKT